MCKWFFYESDLVGRRQFTGETFLATLRSKAGFQLDLSYSHVSGKLSFIIFNHLIIAVNWLPRTTITFIHPSFYCCGEACGHPNSPEPAALLLTLSAAPGVLKAKVS